MNINNFNLRKDSKAQVPEINPFETIGEQVSDLEEGVRKKEAKCIF